MTAYHLICTVIEIGCLAIHGPLARVVTQQLSALSTKFRSGGGMLSISSNRFIAACRTCRQLSALVVIQLIIAANPLLGSAAQSSCYSGIQSAQTAATLLESAVSCLEMEVSLDDIRLGLQARSASLLGDSKQLEQFMSKVALSCTRTAEQKGDIERVAVICDVIGSGIKPHIFGIRLDYVNGQPKELTIDLSSEPI